MVRTTGIGHAIERLWRNLALPLLLFWSACGVMSVGYAIHQKFWKLQIPAEPAQAPPGAPIYPVGVVDYLKAIEFQGNMMVPFNVGAFVSWNLYPAVKVSNDSRYEVAYPPGLVEEIVAFFQAKPGWQQTLRRYATDAILVPRGSPLEEKLDKDECESPGDRWRTVYRDRGYSLYLPASRSADLPVADRTDEILEGTFP
jgi:hypothetical protein